MSVAPSGNALPQGLTYDERGLVAQGVVARQIADHHVEPRQGRMIRTCSFDYLAGNTMFSMHLAEIPPGGFKCNHRHLDETMGYIASGSGFSLYHQDDEKADLEIRWTAGDVIVTPCNAFHKHCNGSETESARQLSFRNSPFMRNTLHGDKPNFNLSDTLYNLDARFTSRFNDEPDYFELHEEVRPGLIRTNYISQIVNAPIPGKDPVLGDRVGMQRYLMGGQRTLDVALLAIDRGGNTHPYRPLGEESLVVLAGSGHTLMTGKGQELHVEWQAGDLVSTPLGLTRSHHADHDEEVRMLWVRNVAIDRALGYTDFPTLQSDEPERFPALVEAGRV